MYTLYPAFNKGLTLGKKTYNCKIKGNEALLYIFQVYFEIEHSHKNQNTSHAFPFHCIAVFTVHKKSLMEIFMFFKS